MQKNLNLSINYYLQRVAHVLSECGLEPAKIILFIKGIPIYIYQLITFTIQANQSKFVPSIKLFPCVVDRYQDNGKIDKHYFYQDLWAARKVYKAQPERHIDVGSRIDGFVTHLLSFREVEVLDVRKFDFNVDGMIFTQADLMNDKSLPLERYDSVSCLHALEHFGLGRYGDPVDPEGHIKGLTSLVKLLKPSGMLLLSVPIGKERIEFNAHRVFNVETIVNLAYENLKLVSFSYIDDKGNFHENKAIKEVPNLLYGCGLFEFCKV